MGNIHRHGKLSAVMTKQAGISWVFILLCLCLAAAAEASVGSDWLKGQLKGDGAYNSADGLATDYQATAETLHTLRLLDDLPADITPSLQRLADEAVPDIEYLNRRIIAEAEAGGAPGELITQLAERRNEDGGFGDLPGYSSDSLSTAFALEALAAAERAAEAEPALNWLLQRQRPEGDWEGRVYVTALAMHALWLYRDARPDTIPPALNLARNWLLDQRSGELWDESFDTALALAALIPHADDISLMKSGAEALLALQSAAGDWDGDVYTTALALRALYLYEARRSGLGADSGAVKGRVLDGATGAGLAGVSVSLHGVQGPTEETDGEGRFLMPGLKAGDYTLLLEGDAYTGLLVSLGVEAGRIADAGELTLHPVAGGGGPSEITLTAAVTDGLSNAPVAGARVTLTDGSSGDTDLAGEVTFEGISETEFQVFVSAEGYASKEYSISAPAFGALHYSFALPPAVADPNAQSTALSGILTDDSGVAVSGAQVSAAEQNTISDSEGRYLLSGIDTLNFTLSASAAGYAETQFNVELSGHGSYTQDVQLTVLPETASFQIVSLAPQQPGAGLKDEAVFGARIANLSDMEGAVTLTARVFDAQGELSGTAAGREPGTEAPLGEVTIAGNSEAEAELVWHTAQSAAGGYRLVLTLAVPGTSSRDLPLGQVLAEAGSGIAVRAEKALAGQIAFEPPLVQSGAQTPVNLKVFVLNAGNTPLAGEALNLSVSGADGAEIHTVQAQTGALGPMEFALTDFGAWTPGEEVSGNLTVRVSAADPAMTGEINGEFYAGNKATALYTVNKKTVPAGSSSVFGNITVSGVDVTQTSVNDPLFFAVREAVEKGGEYTAAGALAWHRRNRCSGCHIQTQSLMGLAESVGIAEVDEAAAQFLSNTITGSQRLNNAFDLYHGYRKAQTILGAWALTAWQDKSTVYTPLYKAAQYLMGIKLTSGDKAYWNTDHRSGWWQWDMSNTATVVKALAELIRNGPGLSAQGLLHDHALHKAMQLPGGNLYDLEQGPDGLLYGVQNGNILRMDLAAGTVETAVSGLSTNTRGLHVEANGVFYTAGGGSIIRIDADGARHTVWSGGNNLWDVDMGPDGYLYAAGYYNHKVWRVSLEGAAEQAMAVNYPIGLAFDAEGALYVSAQSSHYVYGIRKLAADGTVSWWSDGFVNQPYWLAAGPDNDWYVSVGGGSRNSSYGLYHVNSAGLAERIGETRFGGLAYSNAALLALNEADDSLTEVRRTTLDIGGLTEMRATVESAARYFLAGASNTNNNVYQAQRLIGMAEAVTVINDAELRAQLEEAMPIQAALLRERQNDNGLDADGEPKGGWGRDYGWSSDPLVTAMAGIALDYTEPSAEDPTVRKAIRYLLAEQRGSGWWPNVRNGLGTALASTSFVMAYMPRALVRLGGIDADLHVSFADNADADGFSIAPEESTMPAEGGAHHLWRLTGVTAEGRSIDFDLLLREMHIDEERKASTEAWLEFASDFSDEIVRAEIEIPTIRAENTLTLSAAVNKPESGPNESVYVEAAASNTATAESGPFTLQYAVLDADEAIVAELPPREADSLMAGGSDAYIAVWNTGTAPAGDYTMRVTLINSVGDVAGVSDASFMLSGGGAPALETDTVTDRPEYHSTDSVNIATLISNVSDNVTADTAGVTVSVTGPDGQSVLLAEQESGRLGPGGDETVHTVYPLTDAAPGEYKVTVTVHGADGSEAQSETLFSVRTDLAKAISGSVTVEKPECHRGETQSCTDTVSSTAAESLSVPIQQVLISLTENSELSNSGQTLQLAAGGTQSLVRAVSTDALETGGYACVLQAQRDDVWHMLDYAMFKVSGAPCGLYAVHNEREKDSQIIMLDPVTGEITLLGPEHPGLDLEGLAFSPADGLLYTVSAATGMLYRADYTNGELTEIGIIRDAKGKACESVSGLAFRADGTLWAYARKGKKQNRGLIQIDPQTAQASTAAQSQTNIESLAWSPDGETLYLFKNKEMFTWTEGGSLEKSHQLTALPGNIEGLDALPDGRLLISIHHGGHLNVYIVEPDQGRIDRERGFHTEQYDNLEAVAWPPHCAGLEARLEKSAKALELQQSVMDEIAVLPGLSDVTRDGAGLLHFIKNGLPHAVRPLTQENAADAAAGLTVMPDDTYVFTLDNKRITAYPAVYDLADLRARAAAQGIDGMRETPRGTLESGPNADGIRFVWRPRPHVTVTDAETGLRLGDQPAWQIFTGADGRNYRQEYNPCPAYPDVLRAHADAELRYDGISITIDGVRWEAARFDYLLRPDAPPADGKPHFEPLPAEADGTAAAEVLWPSGERQKLLLK